MNRVTHFEIPAENPENSIKFYEKIFGWKFTKWGEEQYWIVETGPKDTPGINGGLMKRRDPKQPVVNTAEVENLEKTMEEIKKNGGEIVVEKMAVPTVGWLAYFKDLDGNIGGIIQMDENA